MPNPESTALSPREVAVLRYPQSHAADPLITVALIRSGYLKSVKRFGLFGDRILVLSRKGRKEQKALPPECFGTRPDHQSRIENDCLRCPSALACLDPLNLKDRQP